VNVTIKTLKTTPNAQLIDLSILVMLKFKLFQ